MKTINFTNAQTNALITIYVLDAIARIERISDWSNSAGANWYFEIETLGM